ncbi:hypothetical protein ABC382_00395 [Lysinibacillus sp. 1P01SD]|uniref:hypothetical protein n=1 Tax=Lysinibacillus sp. 1P01SD TaxID=3132285 RepID=UPI0039A1FC18
MNEEQRSITKQKSHNGYLLSNLNLNPVNVTHQIQSTSQNVPHVYNNDYENESVDTLDIEKPISAVLHTIPNKEGEDEVFINTLMGWFMIIVIAMMLFGLFITYLS